ncbi:MAG: HNH endonuclease [Nitrospira sp.]|nr:HNH endonuclease [Nitrospira sp.]
MGPSTLPSSPDAFAALLHDLRLVRRNRKYAVRTSNRARQALSATVRSAIFAKTGGRCHVCGGLIEGAWHADHVFPYSSGGGHAEDNYLPARALCNNY